MKHKFLFYSICISICFSLSVLTLLTQDDPRTMPPILQPSAHAYYRIKDESNSQELMRVSVNVYPGDELLTQDNKLYRIVRIDEQNRYAFARFIKRLPLKTSYL